MHERLALTGSQSKHIEGMRSTACHEASFALYCVAQHGALSPVAVPGTEGKEDPAEELFAVRSVKLLTLLPEGLRTASSSMYGVYKPRDSASLDIGSCLARTSLPLIHSLDIPLANSLYGGHCWKAQLEAHSIPQCVTCWV